MSMTKLLAHYGVRDYRRASTRVTAAIVDATDVQLEKVAKHYNLGSDADLKGIAQGQILIANRLDPQAQRPGISPALLKKALDQHSQ